ncbi:MAG: hypothetical protein V4618_12855 [Pseudomonadota bacterium]
MPRSRIEISEDGFTVFTSDGADEVNLEDVTDISVYKRDLLTTDLICCDIESETAKGNVVRTVHEEMDGFMELEEKLKHLPGFYRDWRTVVILPAFQENYTVVYRRGVDFEAVYSDTPSHAQRQFDVQEHDGGSDWPWVIAAVLLLTVIIVVKFYS